jgi:small subunit ribosomal protein S7
MSLNNLNLGVSNIKTSRNLVFNYKKKKSFFKRKNPTNKFIQKRYIIKKLVNLLTKKGKKIKAYRILLKTFIRLRIITQKSPIFLILFCIRSLKHYVKVVKVRKAGKIYEVPVPLNKKKQLFLILTWIIKSAKVKNNLNFVKSFSLEILDIFYKRGLSIKYKKDFIKKAYENRAITHFRWF